MRRILLVSQVIPQWYVNLLTDSLGKDAIIDIITGSKVRGNIICSPEYDPKTFKSRLVSWFRHYRFMTKWIKKNKQKKYDLIFAISNPPVNSYIGLKLKKTFHAPFVYMNWDLYPQIIKAAIHNPLAALSCKMWSAWNRRNYPKIDRMITVGNVMAESINDDLKKKIPVQVIPIGVDADELKPIEKKVNPFCIEHNLTDKFVILYSGKMGLGHNIEMILEASEKLKDQKDIVFVFIGFGPKYKAVKDFIDLRHPENVQLYPLQNDDIFPFSIAIGDIGIVPQETSMAHLFMPSKTYSMMACGTAIVGIGTDHDDLSKLISQEKIGMTVSDLSSESLAALLLKLYKDKEQLSVYKQNARSAALNKYDLSKIKLQYESLFEQFL